MNATTLTIADHYVILGSIAFRLAQSGWTAAEITDEGTYRLTRPLTGGGTTTAVVRVEARYDTYRILADFNLVGGAAGAGTGWEWRRNVRAAVVGEDRRALGDKVLEVVNRIVRGY